MADAARSFIEAVHCEAGEPRALKHLVDLVAAHPELRQEIPGLEGEIEDCITAFNAARHAIEEQVKHPDR